MRRWDGILTFLLLPLQESTQFEGTLTPPLAGGETAQVWADLSVECVVSVCVSEP